MLSPHAISLLHPRPLLREVLEIPYSAGGTSTPMGEALEKRGLTSVKAGSLR